MEKSLNEKIDSVEKSLNEKIDSVEKSLNERIDSVEKSLNERINNLEKSLSEKIYTSFTELRTDFNKMFMWNIGLIGSVALGVLGILIKFLFFPT